MKIAIVSQSVFVPSPAPGVGMMAESFPVFRHTDASKTELLSVQQHISRSDTIHAAFQCRSLDNGRTWSELAVLPSGEKRPDGMMRRFRFPAYLDPLTGRLVTLYMKGLLPSDNPLEGMKRWQIFYATSKDGDRTRLVDEQIIQQGEGFDAKHPLPGVWWGKNSLQRGAVSGVPLTLSDGTLLFPLQIYPLDENGELFNPNGGHTYTNSVVLRAQWRDDGGLNWGLSDSLVADPARTTRGLIEPTLALLDDGRVLIVMRGSNNTRPIWPGHKWHSFSRDKGCTWDNTAPWTYDDNTPFFSPSACSQLLQLSNGAILWFGNICTQNPQGNSPRYPIVVGQVDNKTGLLLRKTVQIIDDKGSEDSPQMHLSNFYAHQDAETGEIVLHLTR